MAYNLNSILVFDSLATLLADKVTENVGVMRAMELRKELLDAGVMDIVLICLAQYAQQAPRCTSLRPEDGSAGKISSVRL